MIREKEVVQFITEELNPLIKEKIHENKIIVSRTHTVIKLSVVENGETKSIYYDPEKNCEKENDYCGSYSVIANYSAENQRFEASLLSRVYLETKPVIFLYIKDNILYIVELGADVRYYFPTDSGIPDSSCIEKVNVDDNIQALGHIFIYDINNDEFAFLQTFDSLKNTTSENIKNIIRVTSFLKGKKLKNDYRFFYPELYFYFFPANCKEEFIKIFEGQNAACYIGDLIEKCKRKRNTKRDTMKIVGNPAEAKEFINSVSDFKRIKGLMKSKSTFCFENYCPETKKTFYKMKCGHCSSESIVEHATINFYKNISACPVCHQKSMFVNLKPKDAYKRMYFELLPDKNVLLVCFRVNSQREEIRQVWVFSPEGIDIKIDLDNKIDLDCEIINTPEEIKEIFDNSNIAYAGIPYIIGIESKSYSERLINISTCVGNIFHSDEYGSSKKYFKEYVECFIKYPLLKNILLECGTEAAHYFLRLKDISFLKNAKNIEETLNISSETFETLKRLDLLNSGAIGVFCESLNTLSEIRPNEKTENICLWLKKYSENHSISSIEKTLLYNILVNCPTVSFKDYDNYFEKCSTHQKIDYNDAVKIYGDYFNLALKLGYNMNDKNIIFPDSLKKQRNIAFVTYSTKLEDDAEQQKSKQNKLI